MTDVSILMTVYNGMPYLPLAVESILNQTYSEFEFVIVDDCSTDNSMATLCAYKDPRIRIIRNDRNMGQTRSLNRGLEAIRTELVARMDADDISHRQRIEKQIRYIRKHPEVAAVGANLRTIDPAGYVFAHYRFPEKDLHLRWMQLFDCPVSCGAVIFKTNIIRDRLGGFDPAIRFAQDWELWSRVLPEYRLANVPAYLMDVREHPGASTSASNTRMLEEQFKINRLNPGRILGIDTETEEWYGKVDTLLMKNISNPQDRLAVIDIYFERICDQYPDAVNDPVILKILADQYLKLLYHTHIRSLPKAACRLAFSWMNRPENFKKFPAQMLLSLGEIPGHLKYWTGRNLFGQEI